MDRETTPRAAREADDAGRDKLRVLELYSGIGGMHFACRPERTRVVAAVDVNTTANSVYAFNFPETPLLQRNVQSLSARELASLRPDLVTMSPPCQPFTRQGLQRDAQDPRSSSLFAFLSVLSTLERKPTYVLVENVKGFETSATHATLTQVLQDNGYHIHRYLLSPTQFGVPNSRLRFYCLAKLRPTQFRDCHQDENGVCSGACQKEPPHKPAGTGPPQSLSSFLKFDAKEDLADEASCLLPDKVLSRFSLLLDIVEPMSTNTCCFTKGYGHYVEGTGSVLLQAPVDRMHEVYREVPHKEAVPKHVLEKLRSLRLRYFTPREVARLMCFPQHFAFPRELKPRHQYQLLGNSVNVCVVRALLDYLLDDVPES
ncbi:tRNA (cytosine(38)-C(5))-methyltransferase-like [Rhipicephalus microplus]|uniref:tRNA (cytosine(38)-C(5))-methyltransferase-like n=1 Tax=Rhipicephalus microplus TaxID=6941 RepID=UPI003F6D50C1